jgi:DNA-binding MarR family transcriptional regulator
MGRIADELEMTRNDGATEIPIKECLKSLGVSLLSEWDVLMFLYRHQFSLASAEQIGRLLGYPSKTVGDALDRLESHRLVERSRSSQGVRLYVLSEAHLASESCFRQLISLAGTRSGRLMLVKHLRRSVGLHIAAKGGQSG